MVSGDNRNSATSYITEPVVESATGVEVVPVTTEDRAMIMARLRNSGAEMMTGRTDPISDEEQAEWFASPSGGLAGVGLLYIVSVNNNGWVHSEPAAFSWCRRKSGRLWLTMGVDPRFRQRGIARWVHWWIDATAHEPIYAETRVDNIGSIKAKEAVGWIRYHEVDGLVYHVSPKTQRIDWELERREYRYLHAWQRSHA